MSERDFFPALVASGGASQKDRPQGADQKTPCGGGSESLPATSVELSNQSPDRSPDRNPARVYLGRLAPGSRRAMANALANLARLAGGGSLGWEALPWEQLRYQHTQRLRALLAERYKPSTANKHLAALRGVLQETWRLGRMDAESYRRASDLENIRGSTLPRGRALSLGEVSALFAACGADQSPAGARDAALLAVLFGAGLRRAEAVALTVDDLDAQTGRVLIRAGKGNKEREAFLSEGARRALAAWLERRGTESGPLFCPVDKAGSVRIAPISPQGIYKALRKRALQAGVAAFSPHDLRRSFVSGLLDAGADLATVQRLAGHASPTTTARYDRRGERAMQAASERLHVPFTERDPE